MTSGIVGRHLPNLAEDRDRALGFAVGEHRFAHRHKRLDLGLRNRAFGLDLELGEQLIEGLLQLSFATVIAEVGHGLAAIKGIDCRDRLDAKL